MRLKPGRPDLGRYADLFDVPAAAGAFGVTFLGVSSLLLDDGDSAGGPVGRGPVSSAAAPPEPAQHLHALSPPSDRRGS